MAGRQSVMLDDDQRQDLEQFIRDGDEDGDGMLDMDELGKAFKMVGLDLPGYEVRQLISKNDLDGNKKLSLLEFERLYCNLKEKNDFGRLFKKAVSTRKDVATRGGHTDGTTHTIKDSERYAFSSWINKNLQDDKDCEYLLPIDPDSEDLFTKVKDGVMLCKLINDSVPGTIDERTINKGKNLSIYLCVENLNLALNSAQSIGCNVVNIGHGDLKEGKPHLVLGLLWQIIRIGLLSVINLSENPNLVLLLEEGESIDDLLRLSPEEILIRWVNYQLRQAGEDRRINNFSSDISDSEVYIIVLKQISKDRPEVHMDTSALGEGNLTKRAEKMLQMADLIDCRAFITPDDVVKGNHKLNLAFVANLFNNCPCLHPDDGVTIEDIQDETREEKTYRNWMNSMGVSPYVNRIYNDLYDGLILFQLYDIIQPGIVKWNKVIKKFNNLRATFERTENCNYAVELGKDLKFSIPATSGRNIVEGNEQLVLGLVWQLMRAYTITMLKNASTDGKPISDADIVSWTNMRLKAGGKTSQLKSFFDKNLSDGIIILDLIDSIVPRKVNWDNVKKSADGSPLSDEDKMLNAKYAVSMGRKIGARIYALPEDIVEVKQKMVMTIFACLMTLDRLKEKTDED